MLTLSRIFFTLFESVAVRERLCEGGGLAMNRTLRNRYRTRLVSLGCLGLGVLAACASQNDSPTDETEAPPDPTTCEVNEVFERNQCMTCHGANADLNGGGLNLTSSRLVESLVGVSSNSPGCSEDVLVNVEVPEASVLLHAVSSEYGPDALGAECEPMSMPLGGTKSMSSADVACLEEWIGTLEPPENEPVDVTYAAPALTVLTRVKYLLDGGAVRADELELASGPEGELLQEPFEALVDTWMSGARFHAKRRQFLELSLQQKPANRDRGFIGHGLTRVHLRDTPSHRSCVW